MARSDERLREVHAAHFVARHQGNVVDKLKWLETALQFALQVNDERVAGAFPSLYSTIARCYEESGDHVRGMGGLDGRWALRHVPLSVRA